jgi:hypothetical protein
MAGSQGYIVIRLVQPVHIHSVVVEHLSHRIAPQYTSVPKDLELRVCSSLFFFIFLLPDESS